MYLVYQNYFQQFHDWVVWIWPYWSHSRLCLRKSDTDARITQTASDLRRLPSDADEAQREDDAAHDESNGDNDEQGDTWNHKRGHCTAAWHCHRLPSIFFLIHSVFCISQTSSLNHNAFPWEIVRLIPMFLYIVQLLTIHCNFSGLGSY